MKYNKLGAIVLILCVFIMAVNAVSAGDDSLVGTVDEKLLMENDNSDVMLDDSSSDARLSAANSQQMLQSSEVGNYTELKNLIDSNPNGVISLDKDYAYSSSDPSYIQISHPITIKGNGHTISGENMVMSLYVPQTTNNVVLNDIIFVNGKSNSMLWINGNNCIVDKCVFENNDASQYGAVIMAGTGNVLNNSVFTGNHAHYGGAVYLNSYNTVDSCVFENNIADYYGGAIYIAGNHNAIIDSTFNGNSNAFSGAGVYIYGENNTVRKSVFENNKARYYGGAVDIAKSANTVDECVFENNSASYYGGAVFMEAPSSVINNSVFGHNSVDFYGGAVAVISPDNVIDNSVFCENTLNLDQSKGAALYVSGKNVKIANSEFRGHDAYSGGAVYWMGAQGTIENSEFVKNTAERFGGAVYWEGVNGTIKGSQFNENSAGISGGAIYIVQPNSVIDKSKFLKNSAEKYAGAVYISTDNVTVNNSEFYQNHANDAGAVEIYGYNNVIDNSVFEYNTADNDGGAVLMAYYYPNPSGMLNNTVHASKFSNNKATRYAGAVRVDSQGNTLDGNEFAYNSAQIGGAVSLNGKYNEIDNSVLSYNTATQAGAVNFNTEYSVINNTELSHNKAVYGGALYVGTWAYNCIVDNSQFIANQATSDGGAVAWMARDGTVDNSVFDENWVRAVGLSYTAIGGAIHAVGNDMLINNSVFTSNGAHNYGGPSDGGAVGIEAKDAVIANSLFENNAASSAGGAVRISGENGLIYNSEFTGNNVSTQGGAIYSTAKNITVNGSKFTDNHALAYVGGAIAISGGGTIDSSSFEENSAYKGGAIHWINSGACLVNNSYFFKNHGVYAGGAIACDYYYTNAGKFIQNTRFINNTCVNYGGAVASLNTEMDNCTFINNTADMGGAVHSYDSVIKSSEFEGNHAKYGNDIYHSSNDDLINIVVPQENVVYVASSLAEIVRYNIGNSTRLMNNSYIGMCFERNSYMPKYGAYDDTLYGLINVLTGESIVEYLKLLVYDSFNSMEDVYSHEGDNYTLYPEGWEGKPQSEDKSNWVPISRTDYYSRVVHVFSDHDFRKSSHPVVKRILELYDSGVRISQDHQKMVDGTLISYHFSTLMSPASQSLFLFLITPVPKVEKTYLNTTDFVKVNDTVAFNITVNNTGDKPLVNITVDEIFSSDELEYIGHSDNSTWIKNGNTFTYSPAQDVNDLVVYNIYLKNTGDANLENMVFANVYNSTQLEFVKCANADLIKDGETFLYIDELKANKTKTLSLMFRILDADYDVNAMTPVLVSYQLSQDNYFTRNPALTVESEYQGRFPAIYVGESRTFTVWFKTLTNGTLVNNISFHGMGLKDELKASNKTQVFNPAMTVEKITLNPTVYVGNQTAFTIVVTNTGDCDLGDVTVVEKSYEGLVFDSYTNGTGNWKNTADRFVLDGVLAKGASASFDVIFNTTVRGNFTNVVVAGSNVTENTTANNNTTVLQPAMTVVKVALNRTAYIGEMIAFDIVVSNTGDCDLGNVNVKEIFSSDELRYVRYSGDDWTQSGNVFEYDGILAQGNSSVFTVWFETLTNGTLMNSVLARSNVTGETPSNNTTRVYRPDMEVSKITLNPTVYVGEETAFTITVKNTGDCDLADITVSEEFDEALGYEGKFSGENWRSEGSVFVYEGILKPGESAGFNITFVALINGTWRNTVVVSSNSTEDRSANNTTEVLPVCDVEIIKLVDSHIHYIDENITWTIIVNNNGPNDALNVIVKDILPDTLRLLEANAGKGIYADGIWNVGTLTSGEKQILTLITNAVVSNVSVTNTAVVNTTTHESDTTNNVDNNTTEIRQKVNLAVVKTVSDDRAHIGDVITWTITVTNYGPDAAKDVVITDVLPAGLVLIEGSSVFEIGTLESGESASVSVKTLINETGLIVNVATVSTSSNNTGENKSDSSVDVTKIITIDVVSNSTPNYGSELKNPDVYKQNVEIETPMTVEIPDINTDDFIRFSVKNETSEENLTVPETPEPVISINSTENVTVPEEEVPDSNVTNETESVPVDVEQEEDNSTDEEVTVEVTSYDDSDDSEEESVPVEKQTQKQSNDVDVSNRQTANPIAVLMLTLMSIVALQIKRKEQ